MTIAKYTEKTTRNPIADAQHLQSQGDMNCMCGRYHNEQVGIAISLTGTYVYTIAWLNF
jgi:hypothetical protein